MEITDFVFEGLGEEVNVSLTVQHAGKNYTGSGECYRGDVTQAIDEALREIGFKAGVNVYNTGVWINQEPGHEAFSTARLAYNHDSAIAGSRDHRIFVYEASDRDATQAYLKAQVGALEQVFVEAATRM